MTSVIRACASCFCEARIGPIDCYFDDPKLYERSYIATTDKSWTAAGVSIAVVILKAIEMDRHVAAALMLMAALGLRFNFKQALRRARTVMEKLGITLRALHVTPHGARHQYAAERYEELTGSAAPVAGGALIDKTLDHDARLTVAEELGHGRKQISNSYLGKATKAKAGAVEQRPLDGSET